MDAQLRAAGDAALEQMGITPAEIVRALWAKIAGGTQECEKVLKLLAKEAAPPAPSRGKECLASIDAWHDKIFSLADVNRASYVAPSDDKLDELLYDEWLRNDVEQVAL